MKRANVVSLVFVFLLLAISFVGIANPLHAAEPIKIGVIASSTGLASFCGIPQTEAIQVAADEINKSGGVLGRQLKIYYEDDQTNPTSSVIAATKLIRDQKVSILIGPSTSAGCMSILPIIQQEQIPVLFPTPATVGLNKWVFHILIDDTMHAKGMLDFMATTLKAKKIGILFFDDVGNLKGVKTVEENAGQYGASVVIKEQFKPGDTNLVPQMSKVKAANPDVILFYGTTPTAAVAAKNYVQLGMKQPVVCSWGASSNEFAKLTSTVIQGKPWVVFGLKFIHGDKLSPQDPYRKIYDPFVKAYRERFHKDPVTFGANAYDALYVVAKAIKLANSDDRTAVRDALEKVRFDGLVGEFACSPTNHYGMPVSSVMPQIVRDGAFYPYKK